MAWGRIDDKLHGNTKFLSVSLEATGLWLLCFSWSLDQGTDGVIPPSLSTRFAGAKAKRLVSELLNARLWDQREEDDKYAIHDFLNYNATAEEVKIKRDAVSIARSEAGKKGAANRWQKDPNDMANANSNHGKPDGKSIAKPKQTDGPVSRIPYPIKETIPQPLSKADEGDDFELFEDEPIEAVDPEAEIKALYLAYRSAWWSEKPAEFQQRINGSEFEDKPLKARLRKLHTEGVTPEEMHRVTTAAIAMRKDRKYVTVRAVATNWTEFLDYADQTITPPSSAAPPASVPVPTDHTDVDAVERWLNAQVFDGVMSRVDRIRTKMPPTIAGQPVRMFDHCTVVAYPGYPKDRAYRNHKQVWMIPGPGGPDDALVPFVPGEDRLPGYLTGQPEEDNETRIPVVAERLTRQPYRAPMPSGASTTSDARGVYTA